MTSVITNILNNVDTVEFGIGQDQDGDRTFCYVPVDNKVQDTIIQMTQFTLEKMQNSKSVPDLYEPTEKYSNIEYLYLPESHDLAEYMYELHNASNLSSDPSALNDPSNVFCYFAHITDPNDQKITVLRRATQFKAVLKRPLLKFDTDCLTSIPDNVFKLDTDFDLVVDDHNIHILRPSGFEFAGKLKNAILKAVPQNIQTLQNNLPFVKFDNIQQYAQNRPRAARYLASIKAQSEIQNIDREKLTKHCYKTGVDIVENENEILVEENYIMAFLEVLDRRRFELELIDGQPEQFRASSRNKINS